MVSLNFYFKLWNTLTETQGQRACKSDDPPGLWDLVSEDQCDLIWKNAEELVAADEAVTVAEFEKAVILEISHEDRDPYFCYRKSNFKKHGWCYLYEGVGVITRSWGFCSISCSFMAEAAYGIQTVK